MRTNTLACAGASATDAVTVHSPASIGAQDPALAKKVYLMTDCMSAVTVPDGKGGFAVDFTPQADPSEPSRQCGGHR